MLAALRTDAAARPSLAELAAALHPRTGELTTGSSASDSTLRLELPLSPVTATVEAPPGASRAQALCTPQVESSPYRWLLCGPPNSTCRCPAVLVGYRSAAGAPARKAPRSDADGRARRVRRQPRTQPRSPQPVLRRLRSQHALRELHLPAQHAGRELRCRPSPIARAAHPLRQRHGPGPGPADRLSLALPELHTELSVAGPVLRLCTLYTTPPNDPSADSPPTHVFIVLIAP